MEYLVTFIIIYLLVQAGFTAAGYFFYSGYLKRIYLQKKKLPFYIGILQLSVFMVHAILLYLPYYLYSNWPAININDFQMTTGLFIGLSGLLIVLIGFINLGPFSGTLGIKQNNLKTKGLYEFSRNPQVLAYSIFIFSFIMLWPSWYTVISLISYMIVSHRMVLTEEIHLGNLFGQDYYDYCGRTNRYLFKTGLKRT